MAGFEPATPGSVGDNPTSIDPLLYSFNCFAHLVFEKRINLATWEMSIATQRRSAN